MNTEIMDQNLPFPYKIRELTKEEQEILGSTYASRSVKLIGSRSCCPARVKALGVTLYNFKPRLDDIWLVGFPRSGTTLTQEILFLLGTDLNYEKASSEIMDVRFPVVHKALERNEEDEHEYNCSSIKEKLITSSHIVLENMTEKRFIKSHYGFNMLPPNLLIIGCKIVFVVRNFKDVFVSWSRFPPYAEDPDFNIEVLWKWFKHDLVETGNYFELLENAWKNRNNKNLLILFYEEINCNKRAAVLRIADFLGKNLTDNELKTLLKHLRIENFRTNTSLNNDHLVNLGIYGKNENFSFIRKGECGGWKEIIPMKLVPEMDEWILRNLKAIPDFEIPGSWIDIMNLKPVMKKYCE